jgi:hypothetical protein
VNRGLVVTLAGLALLTLAGCARHAAGPADAVVAYGRALERGDLRAAYQQLSARYRRRVPFDRFARELGGAGAAREGGRVVRLAGERGRSRAEVPLAPGERAVLVQDGGSWRLDSPPLPPLQQDTPRAALRAFVQALEGERYDRLVDLAPGRYRAAVTADRLRSYWQSQSAERRRSLIAALRLALDRSIVEDGNDAYVVSESEGVTSGQVRLVKEEGLWRVENPE